MKLNHFSKTVVGLVRKANEDSIGSFSNKQTNGNGDIFIVCDGMGGHVGGATASQLAIKSIFEYFKGHVNSNPILAIEKAISYANKQIFNLSNQDLSLKGMGTTCAMLLKKENKIYIAHVGDSRIYLYSEKKLYRLTKDHSFVQKLVDIGQLEESEMESHPRKNELTRALGIAEDVEVEVAENPILSKSGDKFLLCSDGLCGLVNDPTILNTINKTDAMYTVNELISLAENSGGHDNISVNIIEVENSPHLKSVFNDQSNKSYSATQVIDITKNKKDFINRYQVHLIATLFILLLALFYTINKYLINDVIKDENNSAIDKGIEIYDEINNKIVSDTVTNNTVNDSISEVPQKDANNQMIKSTNQFERESIEKKKREKRVNENLEKIRKQKKIQKTKDYIVKIELSIKNKKGKYRNSKQMNLLKIELSRLKSFLKNEAYEKIDNQIEKVNKSHKNLELLIKKKELSGARENAKKLIYSLKNKTYYNELKEEISELELALRNNNLEDIRNKINFLKDKESRLKKLFEKQKTNITETNEIKVRDTTKNK